MIITRSALVVLIFFSLACQALADDESEDQGQFQSAAFSVQRDYLTMSDGANLSVTYFMPVTNESDEQLPVLLEMG